MEREQLIQNAKILYPNLCTFYLELIIDDFIARPQFYERMYEGNVDDIPLPLHRDTQKEIDKNKNYIHILNRDTNESNI